MRADRQASSPVLDAFGVVVRGLPPEDRDVLRGRMIRPCAEPQCANTAVRKGRCVAHAQERGREQRQRQSSQRKIYNSKRWRLVRRHKLYEQPFCERCDGFADEVHHRVDLAAGGDPWAMDNLESLCRACHSAETRKRQQTVG